MTKKIKLLLGSLGATAAIITVPIAVVACSSDNTTTNSTKTSSKTTDNGDTSGKTDTGSSTSGTTESNQKIDKNDVSKYIDLVNAANTKSEIKDNGKINQDSTLILASAITNETISTYITGMPAKDQNIQLSYNIDKTIIVTSITEENRTGFLTTINFTVTATLDGQTATSNPITVKLFQTTKLHNTILIKNYINSYIKNVTVNEKGKLVSPSSIKTLDQLNGYLNIPDSSVIKGAQISFFIYKSNDQTGTLQFTLNITWQGITVSSSSVDSSAYITITGFKKS